jgi:hypothetical protein
VARNSLRLIDPDLHLAPRELLDEGYRAEAKRLGGDDPARRRELRGQLDRLRDLYVLDDLTKNHYVMKRQAIEDELSRQLHRSIRPLPKPRPCWTTSLASGTRSRRPSNDAR